MNNPGYMGFFIFRRCFLYPTRRYTRINPHVSWQQFCYGNLSFINTGRIGGNTMKKTVLTVILCVSILLAGCGDNTTPQNTGETATAPAADGQNQAGAETYNIGDSAKAGDLVFTVNSVRVDEGSDLLKPAEGNIYYIVDVTVENTGSQSETVSSLLMFKLLDSDGYSYDITFGPETKGQLDGEVSPGRKLRGELVFEIPKDAKGLELEIDPTLFEGDQIIFSLE